MLMGELTQSKVYLCLAPMDMRKGFDTLASAVQTVLSHDPHSGHCFVFRNKVGDRIKILRWDGNGLSLYYKRLDQGQFIWPKRTKTGVLQLTKAQLNVLLEGMDWRLLRTRRVKRPQIAA